MNTRLFEKVKNYDFEKLFKMLGYKYFTNGNYNINIIGVRNNVDSKVNSFDDVIILIYKNGNKWYRNIFSCTTDPGTYWLRYPVSPKGCAILKEGQYRGCWKIGMHQNKYRALVQTKPITVYRDNNKNDIIDLNPMNTESGVFGINIHHAGADSIQVDKWSAGCQVLNNIIQYNTFMKYCQRQLDNGLGNSFTYTLLNENQL